MGNTPEGADKIKLTYGQTHYIEIGRKGGKRSAAKRKGDKKYYSDLAKKRWAKKKGVDN